MPLNSLVNPHAIDWRLASLNSSRSDSKPKCLKLDLC